MLGVSLIQSLGVVACMASAVLAHGHVESIKLDSKTYTAVLPVATPDYTKDAPSIIRKVNGEIGISDVYSKDMTCAKNSVPINDNGVARVGKVTAGSVVQYWWNEWSHLSPTLTYMARCDPDCGSLKGEGSVWFKIQQDSVDSANIWATQRMMYDDFRFNVTIPACLAPGQYLIRHEIIQLTSARQLYGAKFFPSCAQVEVVGKGTTKPAELVALPGAYNPRDPGILWDSYKQNASDYIVPGPKVFTC